MWTVNNIGDEGAIMISELLKTNTTLTELYLSCDEIEVNENKEMYNTKRKKKKYK